LGVSVRITILGAGNSACFSALSILAAFQKIKNTHESLELELIHDPDINPTPVGQATLIDQPHLLWKVLGVNWYNNKVHATPKTGILYENFGKKNKHIFHDFPMNCLALHLCPKELQDYVLSSNLFDVVERKILSYEDIDSDYIIDCSGTPSDLSNYTIFDHPINTTLVCRPTKPLDPVLYTKHVATPDGWAFVIPTAPGSPAQAGSIGYNYNRNITTYEEAVDNLHSLFDVTVTTKIEFNNYFANKCIIDKRVMLNGNKLFFFEPMESNSIYIHQAAINYYLDFMFNNAEEEVIQTCLATQVYRSHMFLLWHYMSGSIYNTKFWEFAEKVTIDDPIFFEFLDNAANKNWLELLNETGSEHKHYASWGLSSFKCWHEGVNY
jgi:hypothetical protein